jgi:2-polyprenyl-3-methyl-5-hydroxy-6-metoxy-1,4-benzoquinol methylase
MEKSIKTLCNLTRAKEMQVLRFEKEYFENLRYVQREQLLKRHFREVLTWASKTVNVNLFDGKGKKALDVGCAYGFGIDILRSLKYECYGTDVSRHGLLAAKKANPLASLVVSDAQEGMPFRSGVFDLVTCFEVLEHLPNPLSAIVSLYSCCKSILLCTTPNRIVDKPIKKILRDYDETHISTRTASEWKTALRNVVHNSTIRTETFIDTNVRAGNRLVFFRSFRMPYLGLDTRVLIRRNG